MDAGNRRRAHVKTPYQDRTRGLGSWVNNNFRHGGLRNAIRTLSWNLFRGFIACRNWDTLARSRHTIGILGMVAGGTSVARFGP